MRKAITIYTTLVLSLMLLYPLHAQRLPDGEYHRNRERTIDIIHYKADLKFDLTAQGVAGNAAVIFRPLNKLKEFSLDAVRLNVTSVKLIHGSESSPLQFAHTGQSLNISLDHYYSPDDTITVAVTYSAHPNAGMYFQKDVNAPGQYFISTYGEGGLHANWLPIYSDVNDKFSTEMIVTVPPPYTVISNGNLIDVKSSPNGDKTFHWKQDLPHSNYLISLYVGEYEKGELPPAFGTVPINYWVPKGKLKEGAYAFRNTTKMVEFFSQRFDYTYPWCKYDQIAIPDYTIGAMEHTTVTGHRASVLRDESAPGEFGPPDFDSYYNVWTADGTISHELAHHWFGDNLTCHNLIYLWLNESFATYCQMLWDEELLGEETFSLDRRNALDRYMNFVATEHRIRPLEYAYYDATQDMYTMEITYLKGGLVLHTLRNILGDESFFSCLSYYLRKHEFANVISMDFKMAIEENSGKNLDWFFDDWVYGGGYPIFEVSYSYLKDHRLLDLKVKQIQPIIEGQDLFTLPVEVSIATPGGVMKKTIWVESEEDCFTFACEEEPLMVSFDDEGALVAEIRFEKALDELLYQIQHDQLSGRIWALRQMADRFPVNPQSVTAISDLLSGQAFWGLKAEAALLLGKIRTPQAEKVVLTALKNENYRIRKAAVLALPNFEQRFAEKVLRNIIKKDPHTDVVTAAIVALARTNAGKNMAFIKRQINRPAWYDEITLACLKAFEISGDEKLVADIKSFTDEKYHLDIQKSALHAWKSCAPHDEQLHKLLMSRAENGIYEVSLLSIEMLGDLKVIQASPMLEKIITTSGDIDFRNAAEKALEEIKRVGA